MAKYAFDLKKIVEFILQPNNSNNSSEVTETWVNNTNDDGESEFTLISKELHEIKHIIEENGQTIKYDLFKTLIEILRLVDNKEENNTLLDTIVINTMFNEGFIKEIEENE